MFSGIGGFELGIGDKAECIGYSEIDKYAIQIYEQQFKHKNYGDATKINPEELPDFDLLVGGFPCQAFSIAGKRAGFNDTRGTLFFDIARIAKEKRPKYLLLENVKGLLSHDGGRTYKTILSTLTELGYDIQALVLNSKNFGVPQNRERVFIAGCLGGFGGRQVFSFGSADGEASLVPGPVSNTLTTRYEGGTAVGTYVAEGKLDAQVRVGTLRTHKDGNGFREIKSGIAPTIPARAREDGSGQPVILTRTPHYGNGQRSIEVKEADIFPTIRATYHKSGDNNAVVAIPVLTPDRPEKRQNGRRFKEDGEPASTLTAQDRHGIFDGMRIRRLTPVECERLQAYPDNWTQALSDTQRYKTLGNGVTVNVVREVIKNMF